MCKLARLRAFANYALVANTIFGQFVHMQAALFISVLLSLLTLPFYARSRMWDTVVFICFMVAINLSGALSGVPGCRG